MKNNFFAHPDAVVETSDIGAGTRIWAWSHILPGARLGKSCNIGEHCFIENDVLIGDESTVKNLTSIWDGITLEDHVFVGPSVVFTNDKYPRSRQGWELSRTLIGRWVSIGAGAVILCGIEIKPFAMIAAGSVVTRSVPEFSLIAGNPGVVKGYVCACANPLDVKKGGNTICSKCGREYSQEDGLVWVGGTALP